ncbi:uncharacterized protein LOC123691974 isoform X2 [Colias croceus]|uniref:uncharacterized protein LOC123691974 isoform X2 n=1 Tax=Colias crocea TaxID=72248 RepID=UPI001E27B762|nr:uncharacterized protein LOC123691974 isoform X2 [Colias croceus]
MRRIDRILLNALEHKVTDKSELPDDGNISGAPSELEADSSKDINCQGVESPAALVYSPLTALTTRKEAENNNSPMPPMSPSTLELLETLYEDFFTVRHEYDEFAKRRQSNGISK